jgi:hypothetical protein
MIMLGMMLLVMFPAILLTKLKRRGKRSPLTRDLLRSPGEAIRLQIDDLSTDMLFDLLGSTIIPLVLYSSFLSQLLFMPSKNHTIVAIIYIFVGLCFVIYQIIKLTKAFTRRNELRLGLDAELAVGQELNQLMLHGYRVYHDFPADNFNIDHVVFGPNGVFAVETKGRAKPNKGSTKEEWKVVFDGQTLKFPNWTEREFLPQARRQAEWLAKWLSSAVGEQVRVRPVLALPGWYIESLKPSDVILYYGKNPFGWAGIRPNSPLSDSLIQRIAHQIDQKCRDVEPSGYKKDKKSK